MIRAVVLDIEGTVCPISFVKDTLFPYARDKIDRLVAGSRSTPFYKHMGEDDGQLETLVSGFPEWSLASSSTFLDHVHELMDKDVKAPYLKSLQGYLWKAGYESGEIVAPLYTDAVQAIANWKQQGLKVYIYSSGSVGAQQLLFRHSSAGDLTGQLDGYFDTVNAGSKLEAGSYRTIAQAVGTAADELLFFTDNPRELDAAWAAGWQARLAVRPGNAPVHDDRYLAQATSDFTAGV